MKYNEQNLRKKLDKELKTFNTLLDKFMECALEASEDVVECDLDNHLVNNPFETEIPRHLLLANPRWAKLNAWSNEDLAPFADHNPRNEDVIEIDIEEMMKRAGTSSISTEIIDEYIQYKEAEMLSKKS